MLFDLKSGKRRRVVQIIFGFLAFIFFISFVGFGVGSEVSGGIIDAIGLGDGSSGNTQYEEQIEEAEDTLETDPDNAQAQLDLVRYKFLSATETGVETNPETGETTISAESRADLEATAQAWDDYLAGDNPKPDVGVAANAAQAFVLLNDADGAATAQRFVAEGQRSPAAYGQLAYYLYIDGNFKQGDAAADEAVKLSDPSDRKTMRRNMDALAEQARKQQKAIEKAAKQGDQEGAEDPSLSDPFGGLGGGAGAPAPAP